MGRPTPWARPQQRSDSLPEGGVDVAIVGGGLSGLSCASFLAAGGASVVVLEAESFLGAGAVGRGNGFAHLGLCEHPIQLAQAIGDQDAEDLIRLSLRSLALLGETGLPSYEGGIWCASMEREEEGIERSTQWLRARGIPCEPLTGSEVVQRVGGQFGAGRFQPQECGLDPILLLEHFADRCRSRGVAVCTGRAVRSVQDQGDGLRLYGDSFQLDAELVIYTAGAGMGSIESWFQEVIFPVRAQHIWLAQGGLPAVTGRSQHGYVVWGPASDGRLFSGCRWASTHLETGETQHALHPRVAEKLREFAKGFGPVETDDMLEWTSIMGFSCDGLPVLGPLPGQPRKIACVGYNGQDLALALGCAERVAEGVLNGGNGGISSRLQASRFVDA